MRMNRRNWCLAVAAWPEIAAALRQARAASASDTIEWRALDPDSARELEALASLIIPSGDGPGAREAGVIHFIDQALATFGTDDLPRFRAGLDELQKKRSELFPGSSSIGALEAAQQAAVMRSIERTEFFSLLRAYTVYGFLGDPRYGGNRDEVGWRAIGFEHQMSYSHPFGYYDAEAK